MSTVLVYRPTLTTIDTITLDASINENHQADVEVTDHPVEEGADISDHARVKPEMVTIEGVISNTPLNSQQQKRVLAQQGTLESETFGVEVKEGAVGFAEAAYVQFKALKDIAKVMTVVTGLRVYSNMLITSFTCPRNAQTGDALRFTLSLKQVRLAKVRTIPFTVTKEPKGNPKVDTGKQVASPQSTPSTGAHKLLNGVADIFGFGGSLRDVGVTPD